MFFLFEIYETPNSSFLKSINCFNALNRVPKGDKPFSK